MLFHQIGKNNRNNINGLKFYHQIRWNLAWRFLVQTEHLNHEPPTA